MEKIEGDVLSDILYFLCLFPWRGSVRSRGTWILSHSSTVSVFHEVQVSSLKLPIRIVTRVSRNFLQGKSCGRHLFIFSILFTPEAEAGRKEGLVEVESGVFSVKSKVAEVYPGGYKSFAQDL